MINKSHAEVGIGVGTLLGSEVVRQTQDLLKFCKGLTILAFQEFQKVLNSELDSYARYGMGVVFAQKGQDEEALSYLNESCDLGNTWACDALTDNYEDLGQLR